jgi:hypothetical protein
MSKHPLTTRPPDSSSVGPFLKNKPLTQGVVSNTIFQLLWNGGPTVMTTLTAYLAFIQGLAGWQIALITCVAFVLMTAGMNLIHLLVLRRRRLAAPPAPEIDATDAAEYDRTIKSRDARIRELEDKIAELTKPELTFEIDAEQTQVRMSGGTEVQRIEANVKLRCHKGVERALAVREIHASLHRQNQNGEEMIVHGVPAVVTYEHPSMVRVDSTNGWTINEPISAYRWYKFFLDISHEVAGRLSHEYFLRVAMYEGVRRDPFTVDFHINDWQSARQSNSSITLK